MMSFLSSRFVVGFGVSALALMSLVGCQTVVSGGGGGDGGAGGDTSTGTDTGTDTGTADPPPDCGDFAPCPTKIAFAMSHEQVVVATGEDTEGQPITDTQFLFWGDAAQAPSCAVPYGGTGCGGWNVALEMPTSAFVTGATYLLNDPSIHAFITETFGDGTNACSASGSIDFGEGQFVINEITDATVVFTVTGLPIDSITNNDMNGSFVASRCP